MPGAVLELMGCQSGPTDLFNKGMRNISACSITGNVSFFFSQEIVLIYRIKETGLTQLLDFYFSKA